MVDAVTSSVPYSYFNTLNPSAPALDYSSDGTTPDSSVSAPGTDTGSTSTTPAVDATSSNTPAISSQVLALLQEFAPGSDAANQTSSLLGGSTSGIYGALASSLQSGILGAAYQTALQAAQQGAAAQADQQTADADPLQGIMNTYQTAVNAYNNTVSQEAQSVLDATSGASTDNTAVA